MLVKPTHASYAGYQADVDGLRGIAVLSVVIFHAFPLLLSGGFVGVDVFFVISGYLITGLILREQNEGRFSLRNFFARRIRRIFPSLSLVLLFCLVGGWVVLTASEYEQLGKHMAGGAGFMDNLVSWNEAGYFDNAADTKPLLHLWSLGIEEQFYLTWPPLVLYFLKKTKQLQWVFIVLISVGFLSTLVLTEFNVVAAFYSPLTRFWELLLGGWLAYALMQNPERGLRIRRVFSWLGLLLILVAITIINKDDYFPGGWVLLPVVGTAFVILGGGAANSWLNSRILSSTPLVWVGLISYPLYLWHWPLLSFARILEGEAPSETISIGLLFISILLAFVTYVFLECPIRFGKKLKRDIFLLCLSMIFLLVAGVVIKELDGVKSRHQSLLNGDMGTMLLGADRNRLKKSCGVSDESVSKFQFCLEDGRQEPRYAVLGDSKGEALYYGLVRESQQDHRWLLIGSVNPKGHRKNNKTRLAYETVEKDQRIKVVLLVNALRSTFPVEKETGFVKQDIPSSVSENLILAYTDVIKQLEHAGKRVVFVLDHPSFPDPRSCIRGGLTWSPTLNQVLRRKENPRCTLRYTDHLAGTLPYQVFIQELKEKNPGLILYDPTLLLCDSVTNICPMTHNRTFLYSYGDHLSDYSNSLIARDILPIINKY